MHNERRKQTRPDPPPFLPYASLHLAMIVGQLLMREQGITLRDLDHRNFAAVRETWETHHERLYN